VNSKTPKIKALSTDDGLLTVWFGDGRIVSVPLSWYRSLAQASPEERKIWQPSAAGRGIYWPSLDYVLSVEGVLSGQKELPAALRCTRAARAKNRPSIKPLSRRPAMKARGNSKFAIFPLSEASGALQPQGLGAEPVSEFRNF